MSDVLKDSFGRIATDLRVSLTDRRNLRCSYCMPADGLDWLPGPALLTDDEVGRLVAVAVERLGVTEVRFTGGEPRPARHRGPRSAGSWPSTCGPYNAHPLDNESGHADGCSRLAADWPGTALTGVMTSDPHGRRGRDAVEGIVAGVVGASGRPGWSMLPGTAPQ